MSAFSVYYDAFRKETKKDYPVWAIGEGVSPGDYGTLIRDGFLRGRYQFVWEGKLSSTLKMDAQLLKTNTEVKEGGFFYHQGCQFVAEAGASGKIISGIEASGKVNFSGEEAIYVHFSPDVRERLVNLREIREKILDSAFAEEKKVFVSEVLYADKGVVMISDKSEWGVSAKGDLSALKEMRLADASVSLSGGGNGTIVKEIKSRTPVGMRLYGPAGLFGMTINLLGNDTVADNRTYVELDLSLLP